MARKLKKYIVLCFICGRVLDMPTPKERLDHLMNCIKLYERLKELHEEAEQILKALKLNARGRRINNEENIQRLRHVQARS